MKLWRLVIDNSLLLVIGAVSALVWANIDLHSYEHYAHAIHFAVNDIGMVFFFALAAKEVFEATLPGGALASPRKAATPILAAIGGMVAPAAIYVAIVTMSGCTLKCSMPNILPVRPIPDCTSSQIIRIPCCRVSSRSRWWNTGGGTM